MALICKSPICKVRTDLSLTNTAKTGSLWLKQAKPVWNQSRANAVENALAYGPWNITQYLPLICDAVLKWCVSVVVVPRAWIKIYYYYNINLGHLEKYYLEACLERPLPWETTYLKGPHIPGRRSCIYMNGTCHQIPPVLRDHLFMANGVVFQDKFYCIWFCLQFLTLYLIAHTCVVILYPTVAVWRQPHPRSRGGVRTLSVGSWRVSVATSVILDPRSVHITQMWTYNCSCCSW